MHTRLSIIDPRPDADQPMGTDDGALWICYNGEVYGWRDDARQLADRGVRFRRGRTPVHPARLRGVGHRSLLPRLRGMFAFAIVDFRTRRVHVVRDRLGLKPIVYAHRDGAFAFGSTVRSVLPWLARRERGLSPAAIDAYLAHRYVPAPRTIFANIARLPNAHRLEYELDTGRLSEHRYWSPRPAAAQSCGALLDEAIELRLVADRPLGLFLSGGIDSGTIACRLAATGHTGLHSFSAAFPGSALDESAEAAATAAALRLPNERIVVPTTIRDDFAPISWPHSTNRSPTHRRFRRGISRAPPSATSRSCSAAMAATSLRRLQTRRQAFAQRLARRLRMPFRAARRGPKAGADRG